MIYTLTLNPALDRELLVPELGLDTVLRASETRLDWGGKGFNVSRALRAFGVESTALGFVGGATGQALEIGLESLGIATRFIHIGGETRTNVTIVEQNRRRHIKVNEPGPTILAEEYQQLADQLHAVVRPGDWVVLCGSLPPGLPDETYASLIGLIQIAGARPALDTSGPALRLGCQAAPYLVKPNRLELSEITGRPLDNSASIHAAASALLDMGISVVAVSFGQGGAALYTPTERWQAPAATVNEQNPIGAGDAMLAGLVYGLECGLSMADVLRWGMAAGAAAAAQPGTRLGSLEQVRQLAAQIDPLPLA